MLNRLRFARGRRVAIGLGAVVAAGGLSAGILLSGGSPAPPRRERAVATTLPPTTTLPAPVPRAATTARCPLTDLPARHGGPDRPALAVKIGNEPGGARPESGLNEADIVFDTPAEGFIMRYMAVFQCSNAATIGPVRSVRWVDWHLLRQFDHRPILAFAGGIDPNVDQVDGFTWMKAANLLAGAALAGVRSDARLPPDNLYTSTAALYSLFRGSGSRPRPVFSYSARPPGGSTPARTLSINFSAGTDVVWQWDARAREWLHTYSGVPDIDALTGRPVTTTNIVVLRVRYQFGPYVESPGGTGDFESDTVGRGVGWVLRGGRAIKVTWTRPFLVDPFTFTRAPDEVVTLAPGRTWVELVPVTTEMSITP